MEGPGRALLEGHYDKQILHDVLSSMLVWRKVGASAVSQMRA